MELDHKSLIKFYTKCIVLSTAKEGDSLSQLQLKTRLSFTTVHKAVNELEKLGIIRTRMTVTNKGKVKEIIYISRLHLDSAREFLNKLKTVYSLLESGPPPSDSSFRNLLRKTPEKNISTLDAFFSQYY